MGPRNFRGANNYGNNFSNQNFSAPFEDMSQQNVGRYTNTGRGRGNFRGRNNDGSHQKFGLANHGPQFFTSSPNNHSQPNYGGLDSSAQPVFLGSPSNNSRTPYQNGYFRGSYERGRPSNRRGFQHTEPNQRKRIYPSEDSNPARGSERGRSSNMRNPGRSFRINRRNETNNAWASQLNELATGESQTQQHERVDVSMYIQEAIFQNPWEPLEKSKGLV
uniref:Vasculin n=1 Tax=Rhabditophanes sp. KR3021 TaxID=114890 RepID=A0AC35UBR9_9BILA